MQVILVVAIERQESDVKFHSFYRTSKKSYTVLVEIITPTFHYQNTEVRKCISAGERLLITLR